MKYKSLYWKDNKLRVLDQTLLPECLEYFECESHTQVYSAIKTMKVRGAPAIGIAAAYGFVLACRNCTIMTWESKLMYLKNIESYLNASRPTAVNLKWATGRMMKYAKDMSKSLSFDANNLQDRLLAEAHNIYNEDVIACKNIGKYGEPLIKNKMQVLTHCNAGSLAATEYGTALAPIYCAVQNRKIIDVYVDETRPLFQGARLTAWELYQAGLKPTLIVDSCAASLMSKKRIDLVIVGADRIASNGDVANKIGTYNLAVLCHYHKIPFYVAAPISTFDFDANNGKEIPIEYRDPNEVISIGDKKISLEEITVENPAFDITPAELITGIITDKGIISPVNESEIEKCFVI